MLRVALDGQISLLAELPQMPPLTGLAFGPDGRLYFADFSALPHAPGSGAIWAADRSGKLMPAAAGLTMPIDVGFDGAGAMYVLEFSDGRRPGQPYAAGLGRLLRIEHDGARTVVLDRLNYPTAMVFFAHRRPVHRSEWSMERAEAGRYFEDRLPCAWYAGGMPALMITYAEILTARHRNLLDRFISS